MIANECVSSHVRRAGGARRAVHGRVGTATTSAQAADAGKSEPKSAAGQDGAAASSQVRRPAAARPRRRRAAVAARPVRRLGRLCGERRRQASLLRARQAGPRRHQSAEPAARSGLYFRLHAPGRERAQRGLDRLRLPVQAGLRGDRRDRLGQVRDVYPGRRRLDQERRRGSAHGRYHAQGLGSGGDGRLRQGHADDRPLSR